MRAVNICLNPDDSVGSIHEMRFFHIHLAESAECTCTYLYPLAEWKIDKVTNAGNPMSLTSSIIAYGERSLDPST